MELMPLNDAVQQLTTITNPTITGGGVSGTTFDFTNPLVILVVIVLIALMCWHEPKRGSGGSGNGDKYMASQVQKKEVDKAADRYQMVLRSNGRVLFEGTSAECSNWRKENVETLRNPRKDA